MDNLDTTMVIESVESVNINFHEKVAERMRRAGGEAHVLMERFDIIFIRQINSQSLEDAYTPDMSILNGYIQSVQMERAQNSNSETHVKKYNWTSGTNIS